MSVAAPENNFAMHARELKCRKLAAYIHAEMVKVAEAATEDMWLTTATKAGVNRPSRESQKRVVEILKGVHFL